MKNLPKDIETCLKQILGVDSVGSPNRTKIKSGAVVYRMTGSAELQYLEATHKVLFYDTQSTPQKDVELTPENYDAIYKTIPHCYIRKWEVLVLSRGRERTRKELQDALTRLGHAVEVRIGGTNNGWYPASIAVEQLSRPVKPGDKFDAKMLAGEMIALGEALAPIQKTLDEVSLRLRALGIALTINLKE